jgi:MFS family permease
MPYWIISLAFYVLAVLVALVSTVVSSFLSVLPFASDDSPALGFLRGLIFLAEVCILFPLCIGITAELLERRRQQRRARWGNLLWRFPCALLILTGPLYAILFVFGTVEDHRPTLWPLKEVLWSSLSAVAAFFALRIRMRPTPVSSTLSESV